MVAHASTLVRLGALRFTVRARDGTAEQNIYKLSIWRFVHEYHLLRTTLDIGDDVLEAARERAIRERRTVGDVVSDLARQALTAPALPPVVREVAPVYGLRPFPLARAVVSNALIDKLRADDID